MEIPPGEQPRHFECGHALHADCFADYVLSSGHVCPICALDRSTTASARSTLLGGAEDDEDDEEVEASARGRGRRGGGGGPGGDDDEAVGDYSEFTRTDVLDALALAGAHAHGEDSGEEGDELDDDALRDELELQAALQLSMNTR